MIFMALMVLAALLMIILVVKTVVSVATYLLPSSKLAFLHCTDNGADSNDLCRIAEERWSLFFRPQEQIISSRHFVERLDFHADRVLQRTRPSDAVPELKFSGVDVGAIGELARKLTPPGCYVAEVHVNSTGKVLSVRAVLKRLGEQLGEWTFYELAGDEAETKDVRRGLVDRAVLAVFGRLNAGRAGPSNEIASLDPKALALLYRGRSSLEMYRAAQNQHALEDALEALAQLTTLAPNLIDAQILHGVALAENSQDDAAVSVLQNTIRSIGDTDRMLTAEVGMLIAQRVLRRYRGADTISAIELLEESLTSLGSVPEKEHAKRTLVARIEIELANCYGTLISLLRTDSRGSGWTNFLRKRSLDGEELHHVAARLHQMHADRAAAEIAGLGDENRPSLLAQLSGVRGYAGYRIGQFSSVAKEFLDASNTALEALAESRDHTPYDFELIQNLGTIYGSRRYDPTGAKLSLARLLFKQSQKLKSTDFFASEQLCVIAIRMALRRNDATELAEAEKSLAEMRLRRPDSRVAKLLSLVIPLARFRIVGTTAGSAEELSSLAEEAESLVSNSSRASSFPAKARFLQFVALAQSARLASADAAKARTAATNLSAKLGMMMKSNLDPHVRELAAETERIVKGGFGSDSDLQLVFE